MCVNIGCRLFNIDLQNALTNLDYLLQLRYYLKGLALPHGSSNTCLGLLLVPNAIHPLPKVVPEQGDRFIAS